MKYLVFLFFLSLKFFINAQSIMFNDTIRFDNGQISLLRYLDENKNINGYSINYHPNGKIKSEGFWITSELIPCIRCYKKQDADNQLIKAEFSTQTNSIPYGKWRYYNESGVMIESGEYLFGVREIYGANYFYYFENSKTSNISLSTKSFIKEGIWEYFDNFGQFCKLEEYRDGELVYYEEVD